MKFSKLASAAALALAGITAPAVAQDAPAVELAAGGTIYGPEGGVVGTIDKIEGDVVTVNTGTNVVGLPANAFVQLEAGPTIGYTQAQLDEVVEKAAAEKAAALAAALVPGAEVHSMDGVKIGTVAAISADGSVEIKREAGAIALPKAQFGTDAEGKLIGLFTAAQLTEALGG